ncbi:MAG: hypothetical protein EA402_04290 [Planctomycetota bacterium]|nr:MAG: hypothetical protein EA402_04290 [Planctomycetota bacterium]
MARITLNSDCDPGDPFLGQVRGRFLALSPGGLELIDGLHAPGIGAQRLGFRLRRAWPWFPPQTLHLLLCDTGAASHWCLLQADDGQCLLGADQEALGTALPPGSTLTCRRFAIHDQGRFRARDELPELALRCLSGDLFEGDISTWRGPDPLQVSDNARSEHRLIDCDGFGNLISDAAPQPSRLPREAWLNGQALPIASGPYASLGDERAYLVMGCDGYLEVSRRGGAAGEGVLGALLELRW